MHRAQALHKGIAKSKDPCKMTHNTIFAFLTRHPIATQPFPALRPAATIDVKVEKCAAETTSSSMAAGRMDCSMLHASPHASWSCMGRVSKGCLGGGKKLLAEKRAENWTARLWNMKLPRPDPALHVTSGSPAHTRPETQIQKADGY